MSINLELFKAFSSQNQEICKSANEIVFANILNPELTAFILTQLSKPEIFSQKDLVQTLSLILYKIITIVWYHSATDDEHTLAFKQTIQMQIRNSLLQISILFCQNYPEFSYFEDALGKIVAQEDIQSEDLISNLTTVVNPEQQFSILNFVFQGLNHYAKVVSRPQTDGVDRCNPFSQIFIQIFNTIYPRLIAFFQSSSEGINHNLHDPVYRIVNGIAGVLTSIIKLATFTLQNQEIPVMITFLIQLLLINDQSPQVLHMKAEILEFFAQLIITSKRHDRNQFLSPLSEIFLAQWPSICQPIYQTVQPPDDKSALSVYMHLIYVFLKSGYFLEWIFTSEFIVEYLIPAAQLTSSDIEEFESSPSHYYSQNFEDEIDGQTEETLCSRTWSADLAQLMLPKRQEIFILDITQFTNPSLLESYLFLLYQGYGTQDSTIFLPIDLYSQIVNLVITPGTPPVLLATAICSLRNNIILHDEELLKKIAALSMQIIMTSENNFLLATCAVSVFRSTIQDNSEFNQMVDLSQLIPRLIQIGQEVPGLEIQKVFQLISKNYPETLKPYSLELFNQTLHKILKLIELQNLSEEQMAEIDEMVHTSGLFFEIQDKGTLAKIEMGKSLIDLTNQIMTQCQNSASLDTILHYTGLVASESDFSQAPPELVESANRLTMLLIQALNENFDLVYLINKIIGYFTNIMPYLNQEIVGMIQTTCIALINDGAEEQDCAVALFIISNTIEVHGFRIPEMLKLAFELISTIDVDGSYIAIGCITLITSALYKTNGECFGLIPQEVISFWIHHSNIFNVSSRRDIHTWALGLLLLVSKGFADALPVVGELLSQQFSKAKQMLGGEEEDFYDPDEANDDDLVISEFAVFPSASVNISKMFLQFAEQAHILNQYEDDFIIDLQAKASED